MRVIAITAAAVLLLTGCSGDGSPSGTTSQPSRARATSKLDDADLAAGQEPAQDAEHLRGRRCVQGGEVSVRNQRGNSNCEAQQLGCLGLVTTDDVSIYTFPVPSGDEPAQSAFAAAYGSEAFSSGNVVLSYAAARMPAELRAKYQRILTHLS